MNFKVLFRNLIQEKNFPKCFSQLQVLLVRITTKAKFLLKFNTEFSTNFMAPTTRNKVKKSKPPPKRPRLRKIKHNPLIPRHYIDLTRDSHNTDCPICLRELSLIKFKNRYILECKHEVCHKCWNHWCKEKQPFTCPVCRSISYCVPRGGVFWINGVVHIN